MDVIDNKKFWNKIKPLFSEKATFTNNITLIENKLIIDDDKTIADIFQDHFTNAVKRLNIEPYELFSFGDYFLREDALNDDPIKTAIKKYENHPSVRKIKDKTNNDKFSFMPTTFNAVAYEIAQLDVKKASPINSIPTKIVKENHDIFALKLSTDFNTALKFGLFPKKQKFADITPVFKVGDKHDKANYRPVSILPDISKISERILYQQINDFMDDKLSIYQCGFRKGMGAQNCLLYLVEKWKRSLDNKGKAGIFLTDLSKAFVSLYC